jgi:hypothetical protein
MNVDLNSDRKEVVIRCEGRVSNTYCVLKRFQFPVKFPAIMVAPTFLRICLRKTLGATSSLQTTLR